jgi:hypothetical protein
MKSIHVFPFLAALFFGLIIPAASAQTTWSIEGSFPSMGEFNAPPIMCISVPPPYNLFMAPVPPSGCPGLNPFPTGDCRLGGSAFDDNGNVFSGGSAFPAMFHTDGAVVEMQDPATGAFILDMLVGGFVLPGPVSGLGYDSLNDVCWVTDGVYCAGVGLAYCAVPPTLFGPFPLPLVGGALASGLDWDPCTGTLWFCDCAGNVVNCDTSGALISFFSTTLPGGNMFTGLDVNVTNGNLQVTEGFFLGEYTPSGILASPGAFYLQSNPYNIPNWTNVVNGLGFSLRPQVYGRPCPPASTLSIGYGGGYPYAGNGGFTITQTGATPGAQAYFIYGFNEACPPVPFAGCELWVFPFFGPTPIGTIPASGSFTLPASLPPSSGGCSVPVGVSLRVQFINVISWSPFVIETSDALSFTIGEL